MGGWAAAGCAASWHVSEPVGGWAAAQPTNQRGNMPAERFLGLESIQDQPMDTCICSACYAFFRRQVEARQPWLNLLRFSRGVD